MIALVPLVLLAAPPPGAAPPPASTPAAATAAPGPAEPFVVANPAETLRQAKNTFDYGNYASAAQMTDQLLTSRQLDRAADQEEAYRILGLSRFFLKQTAPAQNAFLNLLALDPDYQLDPFYVPPQAIAFFESVRTDNQALLQPIRDRRRATHEAQLQEEAARQKLLSQTKPGEAEQPKVTVVNVWRQTQHSPLLALLPFGAGQFQNDSLKLGWTLLATEGVLAGTSIFGYAWYETHRLPDGNFTSSDYSNAFIIRGVQIGTGAAFFAEWAFGVGEALYHYRPTVTVKEESTAPAPAAAPATAPAPSGPPSGAGGSAPQAAIVPIPGGAEGSLSFRF
jgi:hypothetical protein